MKGVLLCGGSGPDMLSIPKQMMPIANVPLAHHCVKRLIEAGIKNIAIVVDDRNKSAFTSYFKDGRQLGCRIRYYTQPRPLGVANALLYAKGFIDEDSVVILGDNYFSFSLEEYIDKFRKSKLDAMLFLKKVDNPWEYGVATIKDDKIKSVVEKPAVTLSDNAIMGVYIFRTSIIKACQRIKPGLSGRYEITDAISYMLSRHYSVGYENIESEWQDVGRASKVLLCNRYKLEESEEKSIVDESARTDNTEIGENVSIGARCIIKDAVISNSIINEDCVIDGVKIIDSIICSRCTVSGNGCIQGVLPEGTKLFIKNEEKVELPIEEEEIEQISML